VHIGVLVYCCLLVARVFTSARLGCLGEVGREVVVFIVGLFTFCIRFL